MRYTSIPERFPAKLRTLRTTTNLGQPQLAEILGWSQVRLSAMELGRRCPNPIDLRVIAKFFAVSVDCLIDDTLDLPRYRTIAVIARGDKLCPVKGDASAGKSHVYETSQRAQTTKRGLARKDPAPVG